MRHEGTDAMGDVREIPSPVGMLHLRAERDDDRDFRYRLFCDSRPPEFALLAPAAFAQLMTQQFHAQTLSYLGQFPQACFDIIEVSGEPIGRIVVDRPGAVLHIVDQAIVPQWRGRGVGTAIVRALMDEAQAAGIPVRIETSEDDPSLRFYRRLGFMPVEAVSLGTQLEWRPVPATSG
jgi:ribosomal protein S18 acetylase RimI-like enzyme